MTDSEKINSIIRHIKRVEDNCNALAKKLPDKKMARKLIQLGRIHDASKFDDFEYDHLFKGEEFFEKALEHHRLQNPHHPEHWGTIHDMPDVYVAEMVCDCAARGQEFGSDVRVWFFETAIKKYNFTPTDRIGVLISTYLDLLLNPKFG